MNEILYKFKNLNWFYFLLVCFLSFIGVVMIYSATSAMEIEIFRNHLIKVFFGIFVMLIISIIDIEFWKRNAFYIYFFFLITLVWASFFGYVGKGSRRWIELYGFYLQPSEFMKIFIVLSLLLLSTNITSKFLYSWLKISFKHFPIQKSSFFVLTMIDTRGLNIKIFFC